ncbi:MAG: hypothetical protein H7321_07415 [Bacteroidia bacterium]|nr:hypothetical protein [Bacteroidia bacterium]
MTEKALKVNANNFKMLENAAVFDQMDGNFEIAQTKLQKCYEATKQSKYQYKLAENYAQMTQYKSSDSMLNLILAQDSSKNMMMEEAPRVEGGVQSVRLLAKVYLLKAKIASLVLGPKDPRVPKFQKEYVNLSLSIQPDYEEALYIKQQNKL